MRKNCQRTNRAFKIAYWAEVQRIQWSATLNAFCHTWALLIVGLLIPSAVTALQFLAALHRAGKNGYLGCAVAYELLAPQIATATQRPCSVRTLARGLSCLRSLGLVQLHWWTIPDQKVRHGNHEVAVKGTARVETADGWRCCQIRIVTLTERAIALWDRSTCKKGSVYIPHYAQFLTPAKMAGNPKIDQVGKPTMIKSVPIDVVSPQGECEIMSDFDQRSDRSSQAIAPSEQGCPTRPAAPRAAPPTFEHESSNGADAQQQQVKTQANTKAFEKSLTFSQHTCNNQNANFSFPPAVGLQNLSSFPPQSEDKTDGGHFPPRGTSHTPPKLPQNALRKTTWPVARAYLLHDLAHCLREYSRREADAIYERARFELSGEYPTGWPTSIDWAYWVGRFATFSQQQRRHHILRDILPVLKSRVAIVPSEPKRFSSSSLARDGVSKLGDQLAPFLRGLLNRFCGDD